MCTISASRRERERNWYVHVIRRRWVCVSWQMKVLVGHKMAQVCFTWLAQWINSFSQRRPTLWRFLTIRFGVPLAVAVLLFSRWLISQTGDANDDATYSHCQWQSLLILLLRFSTTVLLSGLVYSFAEHATVSAALHAVSKNPSRLARRPTLFYYPLSDIKTGEYLYLGAHQTVSLTERLAVLVSWAHFSYLPLSLLIWQMVQLSPFVTLFPYSLVD